MAASTARSFYMVKQQPFLQAEVVSDGKVLATTPDFQAVDLHPVVVRKVPRYTYQRTFTEVFRPTPGWDAAWRSATDWDGPVMKLVEAPTFPLADRGVPYPEFKMVESTAIASGTFRELPKPPKRRYYGFYPEDFGDFPPKELQARPDLMMSSLQPTSLDPGPAGDVIEPGTFHLHDFGTNLSGFLGFRLRAEQPAKLLVTFDELRTGPESTVDPHRMKCVNAILIELPAGTYDIETFEPYTLRYLQLHALEGAIALESNYLRELAHPHAGRATFESSDPRLDAIFAAARQSFRQNATDIFMDCPSRERAGWLCDSFWTARVEADLTGAVAVERNFLDNYAQPDKFPGLVSGMLPMCYPMDPSRGRYIPNWAMWFVLQLEEYEARTGDRELVDRLCPKIEALFEFFERFENSDGLLENLEEWVFVEWSEANEFVQDVSYPSNMLYAAALDSASKLFGREDWRGKADALRATINDQAFDGTFYRDHAERLPDGGLDVRPDRTEVCQYYAFFFGTASSESRPKLWKTLVEEFGPQRRETKAHPEVHPCNQFPGNVMRMEILSRERETARIYDEAIGYWHSMAVTTGTLWEHDQSTASCNHGFASHAAVVLHRDILGIRSIDYQEKSISFSLPDNPLHHCRGSLPTSDGDIIVQWNRDGGDPQISLPPDWRAQE
ncbi:alpha-L-rhamnosidase [Rhodopirellula sp. SWK7]|nr:alpha-L-rhamnosidase [Rhodopirellula sp. SWK7]